MCDNSVISVRLAVEEKPVAFLVCLFYFLEMMEELNGARPRPVISRVCLGGKSLELEAGSVTALVGPNNSGKSHFLDQLEAQIAGEDSDFSKLGEGLITELEIEWLETGSLTDEACALWADENLTLTQSGNYKVKIPEHFSSSFGGLGSFVQPHEVKAVFSGTSNLRSLVGYFVRRDGPLSRAQESSLKNLKEDSLAKRVWHDRAALAKVTNYFSEVFGEPLSVYDIGEGTIGFKIALPSNEMPRVGESYSLNQRLEMDQHPKIWQQGLGMQSVLGILLGLYADDRPIVLLDEPEAFLHPPQALRLGQILREVAQNEKRQIFCATHDKNVLSGLAGGDQKTLSIIRLKKTAKAKAESKYSCSLIPSTFNDDIRSRSRIRHTHLLDGLFSEAVIIVENEKDAFFFSEALNSLPEDLAAEFQPSSICFVGVGGKNNIPSTFGLLRSLRTPTVIIADTDFIVSDKRDHSGGPFSKVLAAVDAQNVDDLIECRNDIESFILSNGYSKLEKIPADKYDGKRKNLLNNELTQLDDNPQLLSKIDHLNNSLAGVPLCLVPGGQLEDLDKDVGGHGTSWVKKAIEQEVFKNEVTTTFMVKVLGKVRREINSEF